MKKFVCLAMIAIITVVLSGCMHISPVKETSSVPASTIEDNAEQDEKEKNDIIYASKAEVPQELSLYKSMDFSCEGLEGQLEMFTSAERGSDGSMLWDDSSTFFIQAVLNGEKYIIFDKQLVQLGHPRASVFFDDNNVLHIVLIDARTAQYNIYDFIYDKENKHLEKNVLTENVPINYWGDI